MPTIMPQATKRPPSASANEEDEVALQMQLLLAGNWVAQAITVAAELNLSELLASGPQSVSELAAATCTHVDSLGRLLRSLASVDVYAADSDGRYQLTPLAEKLRDGVPGSLRAIALMEGAPSHWRALGHLTDAVRSGRAAFEFFKGIPEFEYLRNNPEEARLFDAGMHCATNLMATAAVARYDFSGIHTLADIGGGQGQLLTLILKANSHLRAILFDWPHVIEKVSPCLSVSGLSERVELIPGDYFREIPGGADGYLLMWILHDWQDREAVSILRNIRAVIPERGRLLVLETVVPDGNQRSFAKLLDIEMMVMNGGRERTEDEYARLFAAGGFHLSRIVGQDLSLQIIEAFPA